MNTFSQIERTLRIALLIVLTTIIIATVVSSRPGEVHFPFIPLNYQSYFLVWFVPFASLIIGFIVMYRWLEINPFILRCVISASAGLILATPFYAPLRLDESLSTKPTPLDEFCNFKLTPEEAYYIVLIESPTRSITSSPITVIAYSMLTNQLPYINQPNTQVVFCASVPLKDYQGPMIYSDVIELETGLTVKGQLQKPAFQFAYFPASTNRVWSLEADKPGQYDLSFKIDLTSKGREENKNIVEKKISIPQFQTIDVSPADSIDPVFQVMVTYVTLFLSPLLTVFLILEKIPVILEKMRQFFANRSTQQTHKDKM